MNALSLDQKLTQPSGNRKLSNDLTCIRGIGATKKQWLELLGIQTIETLALVTAEDLRTQLKDLGYTVSRSELEGWVQQAQALCPSVSAKQEFSTIEVLSETESSSYSSTASFHINFQVCSNNGATEHQIIIQNLTTGHVKTWSKFEQNELQDWMLEALSEDIKTAILSGTSIEPPEIEEVASDSMTPDTASATIQITSIRIHQPELTQSSIVINQADPLAPGTLMVDSPIELELAVELIDSAIDPSLPLTYQIACQAKHLATGTMIDFGEAQVTQHSHHSCLLRLPGVVLQQPGAYRLIAFASLSGYPSVSTYFKVPGLQLQSSKPAAYLIDELQTSCGI